MVGAHWRGAIGSWMQVSVERHVSPPRHVQARAALEHRRSGRRATDPPSTNKGLASAPMALGERRTHRTLSSPRHRQQRRRAGQHHCLMPPLLLVFCESYFCESYFCESYFCESYFCESYFCESYFCARLTLDRRRDASNDAPDGTGQAMRDPSTTNGRVLKRADPVKGTTHWPSLHALGHQRTVKGAARVDPDETRLFLRSTRRLELNEAATRPPYGVTRVGIGQQPSRSGTLSSRTPFVDVNSNLGRNGADTRADMSDRLFDAVSAQEEKVGEGPTARSSVRATVQPRVPLAVLRETDGGAKAASRAAWGPNAYPPFRPHIGDSSIPHHVASTGRTALPAQIPQQSSTSQLAAVVFVESVARLSCIESDWLPRFLVARHSCPSDPMSVFPTVVHRHLQTGIDTSSRESADLAQPSICWAIRQAPTAVGRLSDPLSDTATFRRRWVRVPRAKKRPVLPRRGREPADCALVLRVRAPRQDLEMPASSAPRVAWPPAARCPASALQSVSIPSRRPGAPSLAPRATRCSVFAGLGHLRVVPDAENGAIICMVRARLIGLGHRPQGPPSKCHGRIYLVGPSGRAFRDDVGIVIPTLRAATAICLRAEQPTMRVIHQRRSSRTPRRRAAVAEHHGAQVSRKSMRAREVEPGAPGMRRLPATAQLFSPSGSRSTGPGCRLDPAMPDLRPLLCCDFVACGQRAGTCRRRILSDGTRPSHDHRKPPLGAGFPPGSDWDWAGWPFRLKTPDGASHSLVEVTRGALGRADAPWPARAEKPGTPPWETVTAPASFGSSARARGEKLLVIPVSLGEADGLQRRVPGISVPLERSHAPLWLVGRFVEHVSPADLRDLRPQADTTPRVLLGRLRAFSSPPEYASACPEGILPAVRVPSEDLCAISLTPLHGTGAESIITQTISKRNKRTELPLATSSPSNCCLPSAAKSRAAAQKRGIFRPASSGLANVFGIDHLAAHEERTAHNPPSDGYNGPDRWRLDCRVLVPAPPWPTAERILFRRSKRRAARRWECRLAFK
ncbi:hypothetical protein Purlil1_13110 [Purpureocillium lilacinum]|uniref:Uncharacterized protein n=1 Tax=Purpureocillium lilacinum TaxID=33203 RepID=A0ABR0BF05_PURLI|nr:hypothetical protein Purlil1_13110 [Purpureocillium lilacinum]